MGKSHPHHARKRFGQHFLVDPNIIGNIINAIAPQPSQHLVEIGPGLGALTTQILPLVNKMDAIEFDRDVIPYLRKYCVLLGELTIHQADALSFDFNCLVKDKRSLRVFGNLPYNISTPLLFHLLEYKTMISDMHFMLQKEVVERIVAKPNSSAYSRLSVMIQYHCEVEALFAVSASCFDPPPQVGSAVIRLVPFMQPKDLAKDINVFAELVKMAFNQRRKTIHNSLRQVISNEQLIALNIDPKARPQNLRVVDFVKMSNVISLPEDTRGSC